MKKRVIVIEANTPLSDDINSESFVKKRVCAYARVSTDNEDQLNSYNVQIDEYTSRIKENPKWKFVGMYADEGISGTSIKKRPDFLRLIKDAQEGLIDLVLTKSLSRFSRNTVESLQVIQQFRELGVDIFFEKENLYSSDTKVDFMLTIFSSIAQEEARNISENVKWGYRKRFKEGKVTINTNRFLGYDKDEDGKIIINKSQAETVKLIFNLYMSGESTKSISNRLIEMKLKNGRGEVFWKPATIMAILTNEKYCGDALLQKRITIDYLTHKSIINDGRVPQYYVMNNHEPIIPREMFELIQQLKLERKQNNNSSKYKNKYALSGRIYCNECGRVLHRHHFNYNRPSKRIVLSCKNTIKEKVNCNLKPVDYTTLLETIEYILKELNLININLHDDVIEGVSKHIKEEPIFDEIILKRSEVKRIEKEIKKIIRLQISEKHNSKQYESIYYLKKAEVSKLTTEIEFLQENLTKGYKNIKRKEQLHNFLNNSSPITNNLIQSIFKKIDAVSQNEISFILNGENNKKIVLEGVYTSINTNKTLSYKVIGDEKNGSL